MGMFDTFVLNHDAKCPGCGNNIKVEFQTKELDCILNTFYQGGPAAVFRYRMETQEERDAKFDKMQEEHPEWFDEKKEMIERFHLMGMFGILRKTGEIVKFISDGTYETYTYCKDCEEMVYADMVVSSGIFIGVKGIDDSDEAKAQAQLMRMKYSVAEPEEKEERKLKIGE